MKKKRCAKSKKKRQPRTKKTDYVCLGELCRCLSESQKKNEEKKISIQLKTVGRQTARVPRERQHKRTHTDRHTDTRDERKRERKKKIRKSIRNERKTRWWMGWDFFRFLFSYWRFIGRGQLDYFLHFSTTTTTKTTKTSDRK